MIQKDGGLRGARKGACCVEAVGHVLFPKPGDGHVMGHLLLLLKSYYKIYSSKSNKYFVFLKRKDHSSLWLRSAQG